MKSAEKFNAKSDGRRSEPEVEKEKEPKIRFLHTPQYDSQPEFEKNDWHEISGVEDIEDDEGKIIWAWPVKESDSEDFLSEYHDAGETQWEEINTTGKFVYAIPFGEFREWLIGEGELPFLQQFDPKKHSIEKTLRTRGQHPLGYFNEFGERTDLEEAPWFENDFAVIISPGQMTKRWNKVWEGDDLEKQEAFEDEQEAMKKEQEEKREREIHPEKLREK
ncbi:MAG: hypothetical protein PHU56_02390 [Candidatus Pacebacteria bacterium]|nr:hypothetical protein [Candidatus Paceibacterota bacterium]